MTRYMLALVLLCLSAAPFPVEAAGEPVQENAADAERPAQQASPESSAVRIKRVTRLVFMVGSLAGSGEPGFADGRGSKALLSRPSGVAVGPNGLICVSDSDNHCIRQVNPNGELKTFAGRPESGLADGSGAAARFSKPQGLAFDAQGNMLVVDRGNMAIRKISPEGDVTTFAGPERDAKGHSALAMASGVALDADGNVYVTSSLNHSVVKIDTKGVRTNLAGGGPSGFRDGKGAEAQFYLPEGIAVDAEGQLYVADKFNHRIRRVSPDGVVTTFAGTGEAGHRDGAASEAKFSSPSGVAVDKNGVLYVADSANHRIRRITPDGMVSTAAGSDEWGGADGKDAKAQFKMPVAVAVDNVGNLRVVDSEDHRLRDITIIKVTRRSRGGS